MSREYFHQQLFIQLSQNVLREYIRFVNNFNKNLFKYIISQRNLKVKNVLDHTGLKFPLFARIRKSRF